jgi:hydrogenase large subunit
MPVITAAIDPVTRIEGHLQVEIDVDTVGGVQQVVDARSIGTLFRGFEKVLEGRDPRDAPIITSRICGVCPTAHSQAAVLMLDSAFGVAPPTAGRILRNLVHGACFVESDILHFYLLSLPDFIRGPGMAPWQPGWDVGRRLDKRTADRLLAHYLEAITMRRKAHEMGAIYGGKLPHTPAFIPGGFTAVATAQSKTDFQAYLAELIAFTRNTYIPDVELLGSMFEEYYRIGKGHGHLLSFGVFRTTDGPPNPLLAPGRVDDGSGTVLGMDQANVAEHVTRAWYDDVDNDKHPSTGDTIPVHPKEGGYSWLKAPRYNGTVYECGPISRMTVNGDYTGGVSVMDRHLARAKECLKILLAMQDWLSQLSTDTSAFTDHTPAETATTYGLTEAPRGALGHWIQIAGGKIRKYQVITPTCWNCSPRDTAGMRGPMEEGLVGTPVANIDEPIEALRVIHSFDPCLDCATHVMRPGGRKEKTIAMGRGGTRVIG